MLKIETYLIAIEIAKYLLSRKDGLLMYIPEEEQVGKLFYAYWKFTYQD